MLTTASTSATAATATAAATVAGVASVTTAATHVSQIRRNLLLGFTQDGKQVSSLLVVVSCEERDGSSLGTIKELVTVPCVYIGSDIPSTTGTSDAMNVIL